jgi:hypothetical protein
MGRNALASARTRRTPSPRLPSVMWGSAQADRSIIEVLGDGPPAPASLRRCRESPWPGRSWDGLPPHRPRPDEARFGGSRTRPRCPPQLRLRDDTVPGHPLTLASARATSDPLRRAPSRDRLRPAPSGDPHRAPRFGGTRGGSRRLSRRTASAGRLDPAPEAPSFGREPPHLAPRPCLQAPWTREGQRQSLPPAPLRRDGPGGRTGRTDGNGKEAEGRSDANQLLAR